MRAWLVEYEYSGTYVDRKSREVIVIADHLSAVEQIVESRVHRDCFSLDSIKSVTLAAHTVYCDRKLIGELE